MQIGCIPFLTSFVLPSSKLFCDSTPLLIDILCVEYFCCSFCFCFCSLLFLSLAYPAPLILRVAPETN
uniref:Uncharacterized protein n=1 Tax=Salix viminalis TaxID=40686 RepID=A0A6N2KY12_SALVM